MSNLNKIIKTNSTALSYDMLSDEGKNITKKQTFKFIAFDATDEDFYEIGKAIGNTLKNAPKEITKNTVVILEEVE